MGLPRFRHLRQASLAAAVSLEEEVKRREALEAKNAELETKVADLEAENAKLKAQQCTLSAKN